MNEEENNRNDVNNSQAPVGIPTTNPHSPYSTIPQYTINDNNLKKRKIIVIIGLGIFILFFAVSAVLFALNKQDKVSKPSSSSTTSQQPDQSNDSKNPENKTNLSNYKDDELGLSFSYPQSWGEVNRNKLGDPDRDFQVDKRAISVVDYTFSNYPLTLMPLVNETNSYLVNQGACFSRLGFLQVSIDALKQYDTSYPTPWKQGETSKGNQYTTYSRIQSLGPDTLIVYDYSISTIVTPSGYCNGMSVFGQQNIKTNNQTINIVQFIWGESASKFGENQKPLTLSDLEEFKKDPAKYFNSQQLRELENMLSSLETH